MVSCVDLVLLRIIVRDNTLPELGFPLFLGGVPGLISGVVCARVFYGKPQATLPAPA